MYISFSLTMDIPFFKDLWGYKTESPEPGKLYGIIKSSVSLSNPPPSKAAFGPGDQILNKLLNGRAVHSSISLFLRGVANRNLLFLPGAVKLELFGKNYNVEFDRTWDAPTFVFRLVDPIPSVDIPKGKFTPIYGIQAAGIIKQILDRPEEYYVSLRNEFVTHQPECAEDYIAIYKEECRNPPIFPKPAPQYPEAEKIILDPLSYTSHPFLPASTLARMLVNGV